MRKYPERVRCLKSNYLDYFLRIILTASLAMPPAFIIKRIAESSELQAKIVTNIQEKIVVPVIEIFSETSDKALNPDIPINSPGFTQFDEKEFSQLIEMQEPENLAELFLRGLYYKWSLSQRLIRADILNAKINEETLPLFIPKQELSSLDDGVIRFGLASKVNSEVFVVEINSYSGEFVIIPLTLNLEGQNITAIFQSIEESICSPLDGVEFFENISVEDWAKKYFVDHEDLFRKLQNKSSLSETIGKFALIADYVSSRENFTAKTSYGITPELVIMYLKEVSNEYEGIKVWELVPLYDPALWDALQVSWGEYVEE